MENVLPCARLEFMHLPAPTNMLLSIISVCTVMHEALINIPVLALL